ncbi:uncharacterized protein LOC119443042 [Dermacentor silvarum]|uniref:uncharacterized protein LOC119443042 n=1 Tax=Dermacentor silvarum TaxID=543639 RepID=UPI002100EE58|nr:uncharacterized protein LOC119443042 [Dermacentor silvarum]
MSGVNYPSTGWTNDLARLPRLLNSELNRLASSSGSKNKARRSYKLLTESYVVASTISACYDQEMQSMFFIRARCFRSQKKTQAPYLVHVTMSRDGRVLGGHCECPAGRKACSHLQAVLQVILLLQEKGFQEAPAHLSCTDLPQVWRRPRTQHVKASSLQSVDWRRVDEGGRDMPLPCRLYIEKFKQRSADEKRSDALLFACGLAKVGADSALVAVLSAADRAPMCITKCGTVFHGSPLAYHHPLAPHGFRVFLCKTLERGFNSSVPPRLPEEMVSFTDSTSWAIPGDFDENKQLILKKIVLTSVEAQLLERNSRRQRKSLTWCQERKYRLTASNFGTVLLRRQWTYKGLGHLTSSKDLSRVPAVRYGIANEAKALQRYEEALRNTGRDVQLQCTGLFVNPEYPWLGASPDANVYDPSEDPPWGCVEVKFPYSLKDADSEKLLTARDTCVDFDNLQHPSLKIEHPYFAQVIGQMGVTELTWADFVIYSDNFVCVQRIKFEENVWEQMRVKLDEFYFMTLLPYYGKKM